MPDGTRWPAISVAEARDRVCDELKVLVCYQGATWSATQTLDQKEQTYTRAISGGTPGKGAMMIFLFTVVAWTQVAVMKRKEERRSDGYIVRSCSSTHITCDVDAFCARWQREMSSKP